MSRVDIWVLGFDPGFPESPSDGLRRVFGLEAQEALTLELTVPTPVKRVDPDDVGLWLGALRSIGAEAEERPVEAGTPPPFDLPEPKVASGPDMPPGVVMPTGTAKAKAKAKAEIAALSGKTKKKAKAPESGGGVHEEVHRVIRTPSVPQDRRPPPQRKASTPALLLDQEQLKAKVEAKEAAAQSFGDLDLEEVTAATAERRQKELEAVRERRAAEAELELADVEPRRHVEESTAASVEAPKVEGPSKTRDIAIGAGALVIGLVALYVGVMRFESALLGTGSFVSWAIDALGFGGVLYGLSQLVLTFAGREPGLALGRLGGALVLGYGVAYGAALMQGPSDDAMTAYQTGEGETVPIREVLNDPKGRLAGSTEEESEAIVEAALEGGAVSVHAAHLRSVLGRTVAHVLIIEMPASGGARAHMAALIRRALGPERATLAAEVPSGERWALPLR